MDALSEKLIISLQLQDIEEVLASRKGKGKQGNLAASNDEFAFDTYRKYLRDLERDITDRSLARGFGEAVWADGREDEGDFSPTDSESGTLGSWENKLPELAMNEWQARLWLEDQTGVTPGPSRASAKSVPKKSCQICFDTFAASSTVSAPCGHIYCESCMKEVFLNACIDETLFPPRCCKKEIPLHMAEKVLSIKELLGFRSKSSEYSSKDRTYCYKPACSEFIPPDRIQGDIGRCPKCFTGTCVMCKKEPHLGDCPKDKSLDLTLDLAARSGWQRCKNCHALVEISSGCHHMTCRCKAEWCYKCGVTWKQCQCGDWDDGRLTRRAEELAMRGAPPNSNQTALSQLVGEYMRNLQVNHECEHDSGWAYRPGGDECEMCYHYLPAYIFVCNQCELLACNRCRRNRI